MSKTTVVPWGMKVIRVALVVLVAQVALVGLFAYDTAAAGNDLPSVFLHVKPDYVWDITLEIDDGADYVQFVYLGEELGGCDMSRPANVRECQVDVASLARQFRKARFVDFVDELPPSVNWDAWNWDKMTMDDGGYTPVFLSATIKEWDPEAEQTTVWWVSCSVVPDERRHAICQETHFVEDPTVTDTVRTGLDRDTRYTVVKTKQLMYIHDRLAAGDVRGLAQDDVPTFGEVIDTIYE